jgi:hypothetical protein
MINTFADLLNIALPEGKDGLSYFLELIGEKPSKQLDFILFSSFHGPALVTQSGWKLRYFAPKEIYQLYYLTDDYRKERDLSDKHTDILERLKVKLIEACDGDIKNGWFSYQSSILEKPAILTNDLYL